MRSTEGTKFIVVKIPVSGYIQYLIPESKCSGDEEVAKAVASHWLEIDPAATCPFIKLGEMTTTRETGVIDIRPEDNNEPQEGAT